MLSKETVFLYHDSYPELIYMVQIMVKDSYPTFLDRGNYMAKLEKITEKGSALYKIVSIDVA